MSEFENQRTGLEVAIIGMAGRFPGAETVTQFWENMKNGIEFITFFGDEELKEAGLSIKVIESPNYVRASSRLDDAEYFDASFFGYTPSEAENMDPQTRLLHEVVWETLEDAGYVPGSDNLTIGLYAGAAPNYQWEVSTYLTHKESDAAGVFGKMTLNNKDLMTTRVSYNLDLCGPCITLYTACSTSLVAVDQAYRALLTGQCDIALAGGVAVWFPVRRGNAYQEGMILSPDGHTRAFDEKAQGSVFGEAVAVVALKALEDARRDRDNIYAVIRGSATNNDGNQKVGYTAVGVKGQSDVIKAAMHMAQVRPEDVGFIEAHGTGTPMGDTVEIKALTAAFDTDKKGYCPLGSLKSNVGHLDVAAGVSGLIRTALVLKHRLIPPTLHVENPNPQIDFENSPFFVNTRLREWEQPDGRPRIAGVESFGVGGCNAHVVLEEWIGDRGDREPGTNNGERKYQLLLLSAKTETALDKMTQNLAGHLEENPGIDLADAAYTLQVGRQVFRHRRLLVAPNGDVESASRMLASLESGKVKTFCSDRPARSAVFMFAGLGSQYVNMGRGLYEEEPVFREEMDRCFQILDTLVDVDLKEILYPRDPLSGADSERINRSEISQMAVFIFEYALAKLLMAWGILPRAMVGYSFGEYAAACVAGVFSLEDALKLVVFRGKAMQTLPDGAMLSVPLPREEVTPILAANPDVSLAIDNGPSCIVAGPIEAVSAVEQQLKEKKMLCMRVPANRAVHTSMMAPVFEEFKAFMSGIALNEPKIPYISNVTGRWVTGEEVADPEYWIKHMGGTVLFADGMRELLKEPGFVFVEIGPGRDISTLAKRHIEDYPDGKHNTLNLVRHPNQKLSDSYLLLNKIGQLWFWSVPVDWEKMHGQSTPYRVSLPAYPFEGQQYWADEGILAKLASTSLQASGPVGDFADWFYIENWTRGNPVYRENHDENAEPESFHCLVFLGSQNNGGLEDRLIEQLEQEGREVVTVIAGDQFLKQGPRSYIVDPREPGDYRRLFKELGTMDLMPTRIVHMWGITPPGESPDESALTAERFYEAQEVGFYSVINIAKAIDGENLSEDFHISVVTDRMQSVTGDEPICPEKITVVSPVMVIPQEYPGIRCRSIDVVVPKPGTFHEKTLVRQLTNEISVGTADRETIVAYRGNHRWVEVFDRVRLEKPPGDSKNPRLRENGVYFLPGGMGKIGFQLAEYLAKTVKAKLVLTGRTAVPPREEWDRWLEEHDKNDRMSEKITRIRKVEAAGGEVLPIAADVADKEEMRAALARGEDAFGPINGVVFLPGIVKGETFSGVRDIQKRHCREQFLPKVDGLIVLEELLRDRELDFYWMMSSLSAVLGGLGFVAYAGANIFIDAFVKHHNRFYHKKWFSVDWEDEQEDETQNGFERILRLDDPGQVVFCRGGRLDQMMDQWIKLGFSHDEEEGDEEESAQNRQPRPDLMTPYVPPSKEEEKKLAAIWQSLLGFETVGVQDDFLELGGDSLRAITMIGRVHKELNVNIPLAEFFENPTIDWMAGFVSGAEEDAYEDIEPVEKKEFYPLSSAQKRIYILQQMDGDSISYNEINAGPVNRLYTPEGLRKTCLRLMERHECLRTSFQLVDDEPVQRVHDFGDLEFDVDYFDLSAADAGDTDVNGIAGNYVRPFDFSRAPLVRVGLIREKTGEKFLIVDMHHIITDDASMLLFRRDLEAGTRGEELQPLRIQYKDYAVWQNSPGQKEKLKKEEAFWLERFAVEPPRLNLPIDMERKPGSGVVGYLNALVPETVAKQMEGVAKQGEATYFMVFLAVYNIFLSKVTGLEDVVIGTLTGGRGHADLEDIIGMFVNTLVLRNMPSAELSFNEFLADVKKQTLGAFDNQNYQFDDLVDAVVKTRVPGRPPLFDVAYSYYGEHRDPPGVTPERGEITKGIINVRSKFDFVLYVTERPEGLYLSLTYDTGLFKEGTIERFHRYMDDICTIVGETPDIKLKDIMVSHELTPAAATVIEAEDGDFGF